MSWYTNIFGWLFSFLIAVLGYFIPVKSVIHVMCAAIILDLIFGLWAAKVQGQGWRSLKMWRTIHKLLIAIIIIMLLYSVDKEIGSAFLKLHLIAAWVICVFEIWSMLESGTKISDSKLFRVLKVLMEGKLSAQTGIKINDD